MEWRQDKQQTSTDQAAHDLAPGPDPAGPAARAQAAELGSTQTNEVTGMPRFKTAGLQALEGRYAKVFASASRAQQAALDHLDRRLGGVWPALSWTQIQQQAVLRILQQSRVKQDQYWLCGPVVVLQSLIDTDPLGYARLVTEVFGRGTVHGKRINSLLLGSRSIPGDDWLWVDWMTLSAMRDVENVFFVTHGDTNERIAGGTSTGDLKRMMQRHLHVRRFDAVSTWLIGNPVDHVPRVNAAHRAGAFIYVMLDSAKMKGDAPNRFAFPSHWVRLEAPIRINRSTHEATMRVFSDGSTATYTFDAQDAVFEFVMGYRK